MTTDELRRAVEGLAQEQSDSLCYYGRWSIAMSNLLIEKGKLTLADLDKELGVADQGSDAEEEEACFREGEVVRVRSEHTRTLWRKPHLRYCS